MTLPGARPVDSHGETIPQDELVERLRDPSLTIVNVLPAESWEKERIPRSINLPVAEIRSRARNVLPDPRAEIAVYCASPT